MNFYGTNIPISEIKANQLVKSELISLGYSKELKIERQILDDEVINYFIYNPIIYHGKKTYVLRIMSCYQYMEFLRLNLTNRGCNIKKIYPNIQNSNLYYYISTYQITKKIKIKHMER